MDLTTFIPGILNTAQFSPGVNTPAPFNVNHIGVTDGTNPNNSSANVAEIYNRLLLQIAATIQYSGIGVDNNNWAQLPYAVLKIAQDVVNGALGTGFVTTSVYNNDFNGSLVSNGYYRMKGGLVFQWGATSTPVGSFPAFFNTVFPIAFPTSVFQVYGTMQNIASTDVGRNVHETEARVVSKTNSSVSWFHDYIGDAELGWGGAQYPQVYWFAIGN